MSSAITVIGTGNSPLDRVKALDPRDYFFDGPLANLTTDFKPTLSPIASTDYGVAVGWNGIGTIPDDKLAKLRQLIGNAHALGIEARFWDTPGWPVSARNNVWKVLLENGADWLNADDVKAASEFDLFLICGSFFGTSVASDLDRSATYELLRDAMCRQTASCAGIEVAKS